MFYAVALRNSSQAKRRTEAAGPARWRPATVFACRFSYDQSTTAAVSRVAATSVSFVLFLIDLIFLPFHAWALAVLIGASALVATLVGRPGDAITAGITTAVVMGVAVGVVAARGRAAGDPPDNPAGPGTRREAG